MEIQIQIQEDADAQVFGRAAIINFQSVLDQGRFNTLSTLKLYLDFNFNFNTLSTPTPPQPACATITVRHTFTGQLSVHLFSSHTVWKLQPRTSYALTTAQAPPPPQSTSNVRRCAL